MKQVINIFGIVLTAVLIFLLMVFVEETYVLNEVVIPRADYTIEEWLDSFRHWATIGIAGGAVASLLWYVCAQWGFKINNWRKAGKRPYWYLLFLIPILASVVGIVFTKQAQEKAWVAFVFYVMNSVLTYYIGTALFSPSSFKYTPLASRALRRWNFRF